MVTVNVDDSSLHVGSHNVAWSALSLCSSWLWLIGHDDSTINTDTAVVTVIIIIVIIIIIQAQTYTPHQWTHPHIDKQTRHTYSIYHTGNVRSIWRSTLGDQSFSVAAPRAWNSLPSAVRAASSLTTFRRELKTFLFHSSFLDH